MPTFYTYSTPSVSMGHWDLHPDSTCDEMIINANRYNAKMQIIDRNTGGTLKFSFKRGGSVLIKKIEHDGGWAVNFFEDSLMDMAAPAA